VQLAGGTGLYGLREGGQVCAARKVLAGIHAVMVPQ
jgi:hypothetical protein